MVAPAQLTVKLVVAVPPAGTETLWGFALVTVLARRQGGEGGVPVRRHRLARRVVHRDRVAVRIEVRAGGSVRDPEIAGAAPAPAPALEPVLLDVAAGENTTPVVAEVGQDD